MEANESCSATLPAENGLHAKSSASAVRSDVGGSFSRPRIGANSSSAAMNAARRIDALAPAITANTAINGSASAAESFRRPNSRRTKPSRYVKCIPDTATVCIMPASRSGISRFCASSACLSPSISACANGTASAGNTRAADVFSAYAIVFGKYSARYGQTPVFSGASCIVPRK